MAICVLPRPGSCLASSTPTDGTCFLGMAIDTSSCSLVVASCRVRLGISLRVKYTRCYLDPPNSKCIFNTVNLSQVPSIFLNSQNTFSGSPTYINLSSESLNSKCSFLKLQSNTKKYTCDHYMVVVKPTSKEKHYHQQHVTSFKI
jgi:hypothetical protein